MGNMNFAALDTEQVNPRSKNLDSLGTLDAVLLMNEIDADVVPAVRKAAP